MARVKRATIVRVALSPHHSLNARSLEDDVSRGRTVIYLLRIVLTVSRQVTGHFALPRTFTTSPEIDHNRRHQARG